MIRNRDILNCLPLLASVLGDRYGVKVRIGGTKAYTNGKTIQIPALPPDCDKTCIALAKGYIDHESAHIRFTDFGSFKSGFMLPVTRHLCNSIEDWRVEKRMADLYPGCKSNLAWLARHIFLDGQTEEAGNDPASSVLNYVLLYVRAWEVPELENRLYKIRNEVNKIFPGLLDKLDKILERVRNNCPNTKASVDYSREITALLGNYGDTHPQAVSEKCNENSEDSEPETDAITESNKQEDNRASAQDNVCAENASESETDAQWQQKRGGDKNKPRTDETAQEQEEEEVSAEEQGTQNAGDNSEIASANPEVKNENPQKDGKMGSYSLKSLLEAEDSELPENLGEILAEKLSTNVCEKEQDGLEVALCHDVQVDVLPAEEKLAALKSSNALRQRLASLLQAQELKCIAPARKGKLNPGKLASLTTGNPKIFNRKAQIKGQSCAVHILLDASFSMENEPIKLARQVCYAVAKALSVIKGINPAVTVFPADCMGGVYPILKHGQKMTDRFLVEANGGTPLAPALWWALQEIYPLSEARKIVLVITDGMPDNFSASQDVISKLEKMEIETYGIGIMLNAIKDLFPGKCKVINELAELPAAMFKLLQDTLLQGRQP